MNPDWEKQWHERTRTGLTITAVIISVVALVNTYAVRSLQLEADRRSREANREDERIELRLGLDSTEQPILYNGGRLDAIDIEILEQDYWYSPSCRLVAGSTTTPYVEPNRRIDHLSPFETRKLDLADGGSSMGATFLWENWWCIPGSRLVEGPGDAGTDVRSACPVDSPCRLVRHIRARAKHPKTYHWSDWTEEFFAKTLDGQLTTSSGFGLTRHYTDAGRVFRKLTWNSPADQQMFAEVNRVLAVHENMTEHHSAFLRITAGPFWGFGIDGATRISDGGIIAKELTPEESRVLTNGPQGNTHGN